MDWVARNSKYTLTDAENGFSIAFAGMDFNDSDIDALSPLFERAKKVYETELDPYDTRLGGLYNNMALALVDLKRFDEADRLYRKAIEIMSNNDGGDLEVAITYLNIATAAEAEYGLLDADEKISALLDKAKDILENHAQKDGYYAFVCEKCASVFGYYGHFVYQNELSERARRIYERD